MTDNLLESAKVLIDGLDDGNRSKLQDLLTLLNHKVISNVTRINGFSNLLIEGKEGQLSEIQKMRLHQIQEMAGSIRKILDELFTQILRSLDTIS